MFIKIYFGDKPLFLCNEINEEINKYIHQDDAIFIDEFSAPAINSMIHEMHQQKIQAGIFYHHDLQKLESTIWKKFSVIKAGGGAVKNEDGDLLLIFRRGKWDLPKGKLDDGETLAECALREVKEETGLKHVVIGLPLTITYHVYEDKGKHCLKESHWYNMTAGRNQLLVPQLEEQITEIKWVSRKGISPLMKNTFPSVQDVLAALG